MWRRGDLDEYDSIVVEWDDLWILVLVGHLTTAPSFRLVRIGMFFDHLQNEHPWAEHTQCSPNQEFAFVQDALLAPLRYVCHIFGHVDRHARRGVHRLLLLNCKY
jgi:hypothetical protein